jgi:hypothetical protein
MNLGGEGRKLNESLLHIYALKMVTFLLCYFQYFNIIQQTFWGKPQNTTNFKYEILRIYIMYTKPLLYCETNPVSGLIWITVKDSKLLIKQKWK